MQKNAKRSREKILDELVSMATEEANKERSVILKKIKNTERSRRVAQQVKRSLKRMRGKGIQAIELPTDNPKCWHTITDKQKIFAK